MNRIDTSKWPAWRRYVVIKWCTENFGDPRLVKTKWYWENWSTMYMSDEVFAWYELRWS